MLCSAPLFVPLLATALVAASKSLAAPLSHSGDYDLPLARDSSTQPEPSSQQNFKPPSSTTYQHVPREAATPSAKWLPNFYLTPELGSLVPVYADPDGQNILLGVPAPTLAPASSILASDPAGTALDQPMATQSVVPLAAHPLQATITALAEPSISTVYATVTVAITEAPVVVVVTSTVDSIQAVKPSSSTAVPSETPLGNPISSSGNVSSETPVVAAYYPDWTSESMVPEQIDFKRFDWVDFGEIHIVTCDLISDTHVQT
jgi:hypothetical protein